MKDFNARVFRLLAKEMKVEDLSVPKEEPGEPRRSLDKRHELPGMVG